MFSKYYTCDLITLNGEQIKKPSVIVEVSRWLSPMSVLRAIVNQLERDGLGDHRVINFRRIT